MWTKELNLSHDDFAFGCGIIGELPSDELLQELSKFFTPPGFPTPKDGMKIPKELRDQFSEAITPAVSTLSDAGVMSFFNQAVISFEQIPKLVDEVSDVEEADPSLPC